jgi:hypothetical protein
MSAFTRWDDSVAPGGMVCTVCGAPVESEPCWEHDWQARAEHAEDALRDIRDHGTRHDTTPTVCGSEGVEWWYRYVQSMDAAVRDAAGRALDQIEASS